MGWKLNQIIKDEILMEVATGFIYCVFTDRLYIGRWRGADTVMEYPFDHLLECRIFNEKQEIYVGRPDLGSRWRKRYISEKKEDERISDSLEEENFLLKTTGGGQLLMPVDVETYPKIRIKNYLAFYASTGQAYVVDWRIVGFVKDGEKKVAAEQNEIQKYLVGEGEDQDRTDIARTFEAYYEDQFIDKN